MKCDLRDKPGTRLFFPMKCRITWLSRCSDVKNRGASVKDSHLVCAHSFFAYDGLSSIIIKEMWLTVLHYIGNNALWPHLYLSLCQCGMLSSHVFTVDPHQCVLLLKWCHMTSKHFCSESRMFYLEAWKLVLYLCCNNSLYFEESILVFGCQHVFIFWKCKSHLSHHIWN